MADDKDYGSFNPDNQNHRKMAYLLHEFIEENPMIRTPDLKDKLYEYLYAKGDHQEKGKKEEWAVKTKNDGITEDKWSESTIKNIYVPNALKWMEDDESFPLKKIAKEDGKTGGKKTHHWKATE